MNQTPTPAGPQRAREPLSEAAKVSLATTHTLFRIFIIAVLGAFFVYQLDVSYLWLTAILTATSIILGVVLMVRAIRRRESKLVLVGTISGLAVSLVMVLLVLFTAVFFNQVQGYQDCVAHALTVRAQSACANQLGNSVPAGLP